MSKAKLNHGVRIVSAALYAVAAGCLRVSLPQANLMPAAPAHELAWQEAVALALRQHPDIRQAQEQVRASAHNRNAAFGGYLPTIDGGFNRRRSRSTNTQPTADSVAFDVDVTQPLFTGFATTGDYLQARRQWEAATWAYRETSAEVRSRLRTAFVELLRLQTLLNADRIIADRRKENADLIRLRYDAGRENRGSLLRSEAISEDAQFTVRQIERAQASQQLAFARELGGRFDWAARPSADLGDLIPALPEPPADYGILAENTPGVQRLLKTAESQKAAVLSSQADLWPTVQGTFNYGYSGPEISSMRDDATLGLSVSVPFFAGGQNVEDVWEARSDYRAALEAARSARDAQIAGLSEAWTAFRDAREFLDVKKKFLEAARERAEIVRSQYTSGLADFQAFDIAEQELADSEKAYVQSLADVLTRESQWELAKGTTLEDSLNGAR